MNESIKILWADKASERKRMGYRVHYHLGDRPGTIEYEFRDSLGQLSAHGVFAGSEEDFKAKYRKVLKRHNGTYGVAPDRRGHSWKASADLGGKRIPGSFLV